MNLNQMTESVTYLLFVRCVLENGNKKLTISFIKETDHCKTSNTKHIFVWFIYSLVKHKSLQFLKFSIWTIKPDPVYCQSHEMTDLFLTRWVSKQANNQPAQRLLRHVTTVDTELPILPFRWTVFYKLVCVNHRNEDGFWQGNVTQIALRRRGELVKWKHRSVQWGV